MPELSFSRLQASIRSTLLTLQSLPRFAKSHLTLLTVIAVVLILMLISAVFVTYWDWLQIASPDRESNSTTIRNIGFVVAGLVALPIAIWRSRTAQIQADTALRELRSRTYREGADMLRNCDLSIRLEGIAIFALLVKDDHDRYRVQVDDRLCAFIREATREQLTDDPDQVQSGQAVGVRADIQAAILVIGTRNKRGRARERRLNLQYANLSGAQLMNADLAGAELQCADLSSPYIALGGIPPKFTLGSFEESNRPWRQVTVLIGTDLSGAHLWDSNFAGANLQGANLSGANLPGANLSRATFMGADLSKAVLDRADLSNAFLVGADLSESQFYDANLSGTDLSGINWNPRNGHPARGLTQEQLDQACADEENPPLLDGVHDAISGKQLIWRGNSL